ncbi:MAG TPA: cytochrome c oxidase subunit II, partial [Anaeromyxobacteraceae bacterium]|nr:cytochrome c oxidase subunit II [Anaeromyxobacteraceae bacterium]
VVRYRRRAARPEPEASPSHDTRLELIWTGIPLVLVLAMFAMSTRTWLEMTDPAGGADALRVQVTARKWSWWFDHPGGKGAAELHLVANRPAELVLSATDVIHSLYVPEFRVKQDAVPGRFTRLTITPTVAGTFPILCTEYCGTDHSRMTTVAVVHPDQASFDAWAREGVAPDGSLVDLGKQVFAKKGCFSSRFHSPATVGPILRESLLKPAAKIVAGFPNVMPPVPVEERELKAIAAYLETLVGDVADARKKREEKQP